MGFLNDLFGDRLALAAFKWNDPLDKWPSFSGKEAAGELRPAEIEGRYGLL